MRSQFVAAILALSGGTLVAQLLMAASSPVLTRLYTPAEFGLLGMFIASIGSLAPAACGKYEIALVVSHDERETNGLLTLALSTCVLASIITFFILFFFGEPVMAVFGLTGLNSISLLIAPTILIIGTMNVLGSYVNKLERYKLLSFTKATSAIALVITSVLCGLYSFEYGLIVGHVVSVAAFSGVLIAVLWADFKSRKLPSAKSVLYLSKKFKDFPMYSATSGVVDGVTQVLPIFFLAKYFGNDAVGAYALVLRVALAPVGFISSAISKVNLKRVSSAASQGKPVLAHYKKSVAFLFLIFSPFLAIFAGAGPDLFSFVFGGEWREAGAFLQVMAPAVAIKFVASALSTTIGATRNNRLGALWKLGAFMGTFSVFMLFAPTATLFQFIIIIATVDFVVYGAYLYVSWYAAGHPRNTL